jgi:SAM-dependent methyltransferase
VQGTGGKLSSPNESRVSVTAAPHILFEPIKHRRAKFTVLDVGCSRSPKGDVNVDVSKGSLADVICDAEHLPFADNAFTIVRSSHLIEHVDDPELALDEMVRVCTKKVFVRCPHRLSLNAGRFSNKYHKHLFKIKWFDDYCRKHRLGIEAEITFSLTRFLELRTSIIKLDNYNR